MNKKWIYRIVGFGIGFGIGEVVYRKFYKPKIDQRMKEIEDEIDQKVETMVESAFKPELDAFREETQEQIAKWNEESDRKVREATEEMEKIANKFKIEIPQKNRVIDFNKLEELDTIEERMDYIEKTMNGVSD